jgi:hypothetical protein
MFTGCSDIVNKGDPVMDNEGSSYYDALNLDRRASPAQVEASFLRADEAFRDLAAVDGWEGEAQAGSDLIQEAYNVRGLSLTTSNCQKHHYI